MLSMNIIRLVVIGIIGAIIFGVIIYTILHDEKQSYIYELEDLADFYKGTRRGDYLQYRVEQLRNKKRG